MKTYSHIKLRAYILREHGLTEEHFFDPDMVSKAKKKRLLNELFLMHTGYHLTDEGLEKKGGLDTFDGYTHFDDLQSFHDVEADIYHTLRLSKSRSKRMKRHAHIKKKTRFQNEQFNTVRDINDEIYLAKWEPDTKSRRDKLKRLKNKRDQEQNRQYER